MTNEKNMIDVGVCGNIDGEFGGFVYTSIIIPEDYTMNDVVKACALQGLKTFLFGNMKRLTEVPAWARAWARA